MRRPLILDLDFTLLHLEWRPGSIEVPGRTRSAWIAPQTAQILAQLSQNWDIVLATARSFDGTKWVVDGLEKHGAATAFLVVEDGARLGERGDALRAFEPQFDLVKWRALLENSPHRFEWQNDFQSCLVARCETGEQGETVFLDWAARFENQANEVRFFRDGRKVYALPARADKWRALQLLLGERAAQAAGVGDGANDLVWLPNVAFPATFARAKLVLVEKISERGGFVSALDGHDGIAQILRKWL